MPQQQEPNKGQKGHKPGRQKKASKPNGQQGDKQQPAKDQEQQKA